jgi:hypothetical protein
MAKSRAITVEEEKEPVTIRLEKVRMINAHATSAGNSLPGDVLELTAGEAQPLVDAGYAVRVAS